MKTFGKYLREQRLVTSSELEEALRSQAVYGGRLGTNLVELKLLSSEDLMQHLARHTGFPAARADLLQSPERAALKAVPIELARSYSLLALKLEEGLIQVAMLDPRDRRQIQEVAQATGRKVRPHVAPEAELLLALEKHLGISRPLRFVSSMRQRAQELLLSEEAPPDAGPARERAMDALGIRPLSKDEELLDAENFLSLHADLALARDAAENGGIPAAAQQRAPEPAAVVPAVANEPAAAPPSTLAEVAALETEIARAPGRDQVAALALRLARAYVPAAVLFVVHPDAIMGFHAEGLDQGVEGIVIPVNVDSVFALPAATGERYRGGPPKDGLDARILRLLGRADVSEMVVLPLAIRDRVVNVLYADNGDQPLLETAVAALEAVAACVSRAYERIIIYRKSLTE